MNEQTPKTLTPPNADEDVEQQKLIHCWWELQSGTDVLEDTSAISSFFFHFY